jgi:hypothetical protein
MSTIKVYKAIIFQIMKHPRPLHIPEPLNKYLPARILKLSGDIETNPPPPPPTSNTTECSSASSCSTSLSIEDSIRLSFVQLNVQSLKPKLDVLESELHNHCVLSFTETWLNNDESASDISLKNFQAPFCHSRKHKTAGGVAVYVKDHMEPDTVECFWLELAICGQIYLYGPFYRPPNSLVSLWDDI